LAAPCVEPIVRRICLLLLVGCAHAAPPQTRAPAAGLPDGEFQLVRGRMEQLLAYARADADCGKLTADLESMGSDPEVIDGLRQVSATPSAEQSAALAPIAIELTVALSRCSLKSAPPPTPVATRIPQAPQAGAIPEAAFEAMMTAIKEMATIAQRDKGNCDLMANDLTVWVDSHTTLVAELRSMRNFNKPTPEQMKKLEEVMPQLMTLSTCAANPKMKALQDRMK
jgi:hypothetical protein